MAEVEHRTENSEEEYKINCRSQRSVRKIEGEIESRVDRLIHENKFWTEYEKNSCRTRFKEVRTTMSMEQYRSSKMIFIRMEFVTEKFGGQNEVSMRYLKFHIFEKTLHDNILVQNQGWMEGNDDQEDTSEIEPINEELKSRINGAMLPELDEAIVTTAMKRKNCPLSAANNCAKAFKAEKIYMCKVKVKLPEDSLDISMPEIPTSDESEKGLFDALKDLNSMIKEFPDLVDKMMHVRAASTQLASDQGTPSGGVNTNLTTCRKLAFSADNQPNADNQSHTAALNQSNLLTVLQGQTKSRPPQFVIKE